MRRGSRAVQPEAGAAMSAARSFMRLRRNTVNDANVHIDVQSLAGAGGADTGNGLDPQQWQRQEINARGVVFFDCAMQTVAAVTIATRFRLESQETAMRRCSRRQFVRGLAGGLGGVLLESCRFTFAAGTIAVDDKSVLIVVDVQNCFLPGGSLAVKDGDQVRS